MPGNPAMAVCSLPFFLHPSLSFPKMSPLHLNSNPQQYPSRRNLSLACSAEKSAEKSSKKGKPSRVRMADDELCKELREVMAAAGISDDRVPTTKELSENGRKDLANIVKRRGYKVILELLRHSFEKDPSTEKNPLGNQDTSNACRDEASEDQERNLNKSAGCFSTRGSSSENDFVVRVNGSAVSGKSFESSKSSIRNLQFKANNFIHTGILDTVEETSEVGSTDMPTESEVNPNILSSYDTDSETSEVGSTDLPTESEVNPNILSSYDTDSASVDPRQAYCSVEHQFDWDDTTSNEEFKSVEHDMNLDSEMAAEKDNEIEIERLKAMLQRKQMELFLLKQQIEMEMQALSDLQAKANVEIGNAQRIVSARDTELNAAEESLLGLKEVQIEYWVNGECVEIAGSFNGWDHRVKMDPHPSADTINPPKSRITNLWLTVLWLYPGMYEIKFIVDGDWRIDSQRETVNNCGFENNILKVDR